MPDFIKHVGQVNDTGKKCVVVFREIPGEPTSCLIVETESLPQLYHDDLIMAVEGESAQSDIDFYKYASRSTFHDGRNMLEAMHISGWLRKTSTNKVTMFPTREIKISLNDLNTELNSVANEGKTTSSDISRTNDVVQESGSSGTLSDSQIANQMRSQAAYFKQEAERLYAEANALDPQQPDKIEVVNIPSKTDTAKKARGRPKKK